MLRWDEDDKNVEGYVLDKVDAEVYSEENSNSRRCVPKLKNNKGCKIHKGSNAKNLYMIGDQTFSFKDFIEKSSNYSTNSSTDEYEVVACCFRMSLGCEKWNH